MEASPPVPRNDLLKKQKYGEVFTPIVLVNEMLGAFPKSTWSNPNLKFLDPCAGQGIFVEGIVTRCMSGLSRRIPDVRKRKHHILTKMIWACELHPTNCRILVQKFGPRLQLFRGDFLSQKADQWLWKDDVSKETKTEDLFHVVVMNPPYQTSKDDIEGGVYKGSQGNRTLWDKFLWKAVTKLLHPIRGYLGCITPANWRRPEHTLYDTLCHSTGPKQHRLLFLHIYGKQDGMQYFQVQSRFDVYVVAMSSSSSTQPLPKIIDEQGNIHHHIDPTKWPFLPNYAYGQISKLMVSDPTKKHLLKPVIFDASTYDARHCKDHPTKTFRYPIIHTITQKGGPKILYASERDSDQFGVGKVILNMNERQYPVNDWKGEYGMSQLSFGLPVSSKAVGEKLIRKIESEEFQEILRATKWGAFQTDYRMFRYLNLQS